MIISNKYNQKVKIFPEIFLEKTLFVSEEGHFFPKIFLR